MVCPNMNSARGVDRNTTPSLTGAVCVLLVNRIPVMPDIAIGSILSASDQPVHIGYVELSDVQAFENHPRVILVDLSEDCRDLELGLIEKDYTGWNNNDFFRIVQLKWSLLNRMLGLGFDFVIYSDLDVIWQLDAFQEVSHGFDSRPAISIQIQSFTRSPHKPKLCMGFVAFRNDYNSRSFIEQGAKRHNHELRNDSRIGDDDVATLMYVERGFPSFIYELPQTTFPVGVSLNLFRGKSAFPGLIAQEPFIFHANFVVGLPNKILLMKVFLGRRQRQLIRAKFTIGEKFLLESKRIRHKLHKRIKR